MSDKTPVPGDSKALPSWHASRLMNQSLPSSSFPSALDSPPSLTPLAHLTKLIKSKEADYADPAKPAEITFVEEVKDLKEALTMEDCRFGLVTSCAQLQDAAVDVIVKRARNKKDVDQFRLLLAGLMFDLAKLLEEKDKTVVLAKIRSWVVQRWRIVS